MSHDATATQTWSWGDIFELDMPEAWVVRDLEEAVEIAPPGSAPRSHLAVLDLADGVNERAVRTLLESFATDRGAKDTVNVQLITPRKGVLSGRVPFFDGAHYWLALVTAWNEYALLTTIWSPTVDTSLFTQVESMLATIRLKEVREPVGDWLEADPPGEF